MHKDVLGRPINLHLDQIILYMLIFRLLVANEQESLHRKKHLPTVSTADQSDPDLLNVQIVPHQEDWEIIMVNFVLISKHGGRYQI